MTSRRQQTRLPMTAAVMTLVGTTRGQLSSSLPSPQSSWASHTHDSNTQRLFCRRGAKRRVGWCLGGREPGPSGAGLGGDTPCSGSFPAGRRSSSSRRNRWGSGSGSCSGLTGGSRPRCGSRGTRQHRTWNSWPRHGRLGSASSRRSAAAPCSSPSCRHRGPPRAGRSPPPGAGQRHVNTTTQHQHNSSTQQEDFRVSTW